jgi:hypothetical protein
MMAERLKHFANFNINYIYIVLTESKIIKMVCIKLKMLMILLSELYEDSVDSYSLYEQNACADIQSRQSYVISSEARL